MFKSTKTSFIVRGIAFTTLGLLCFFSQGTMETLANIAGLALFVSGLVFFIMRMKNFIKGFETMRLSLSLLMMVMGALVIFRKDIIITVLGVFVIFEGLDFVLNAIKYARAKAKGWWIMLLAALAVVGLGGWTILFPGNAQNVIENTIRLLLGFGFIGIGISCFVGLAGVEALEKFFEEKREAAETENNEDYVEAEVVK